jgi:hypothetical protein
MMKVPFSCFQNICLVWLGKCTELLDSNSFVGYENSSASVMSVIIMSI